MKPRLFAALWILFSLAACTKKELPIEKPTQEPARVRFTSTNPAGDPTYNAANLKLAITLAGTNSTVVEKQLTLSFNGGVSSEYLSLTPGTYHVTSYRYIFNDGITHFATPRQSSAYAHQVAHPLPLSFTVSAGATFAIPMDVLKVPSGETGAGFGYTPGSFRVAEHEAQDLQVSVRLRVSVGDVDYDSIPATLGLKWWLPGGEDRTRLIEMHRITNFITIPKEATRVEMRISRWGYEEVKSFERGELQNNMLIEFHGHVAPKLLKETRTYRIENGKEIPNERTGFHYDTEGRLIQVDYWKRTSEGVPYLAYSDLLDRSGKLLTRSRRIRTADQKQLFVTTFSYTNGMLTGMMQVDSDGVKSQASIIHYPESNVLQARYSLSNGAFERNVYHTFEKGNARQVALSQTHDINALTNSSFDYLINPYKHMGWTDFELAHMDKNNPKVTTHAFNGMFPPEVPYTFDYRYNELGYPTEVTATYKTYPGPVYNSSRVKTVFVY